MCQSKDECDSKDKEKSSSLTSASVHASPLQYPKRRQLPGRGHLSEQPGIELSAAEAIKYETLSHFITDEEFAEPTVQEQSSLQCWPLTIWEVPHQVFKSMKEPRRPLIV